MRAILFERHGSPEVLRYEEIALPRLRAGEVLVKVGATGLNQVDRVVRMGYPGLTLELPHILGGDIAGTVVESGPETTAVKPGDRVVAYPVVACETCPRCTGGEPNLCLSWQYFGMHRHGGYAEYVAVPAKNLVPLPDSVSFEAAAALPVAGLTAFHALATVGRLEAGQTFFLWGGTGALGSLAVQIAKSLGARVIATGSSPERLALLRSLGADLALDRNRDDVAARVREFAPSGVDLVLDYVGPQTFSKSFEMVRKGGQILLCGILTGRETTISLHQTYLRHLSVKGLYLGTLAELRQLVGWLAEGRIKPNIGGRFALADARGAHELLDAGQTMGKVVLEP